MVTINSQISEAELETIRKSRAVRRKLAWGSHLLHFSIYHPHYIKYPLAPFHYKMFGFTEDNSVNFLVGTAFRDSGKSTIFTLSFPIWSITAKPERKFVLIASQTQTQAKIHLSNIRKELEKNEWLKKDAGPFREESDEWGATSLVLPNYDARIAAVSTEQSIRGIRHGANRPDLIICDDVEDTNSNKTKESRDKTWDWFSGEIMPIGSRDTKVIVVGNLLHEDSLIMRLKSSIAKGQLSAEYFQYPLVDDNNNITWLGKFPTHKEIEKLKSTVPSEVAWYREYLLKIISDEERIIHPEWINYYESLPPDNGLHSTATGIDLAISKKDTADYTSMVSGNLYGSGKDKKMYILPNPINRRMTFPESIETAKNLSQTLGSGSLTKLLVEEVAYQASFVQQLEEEGYPAKGVKPHGQDKKARIASLANLIKSGKILFSKTGNEDLIRQLTGFGVEKHDDLADAFTVLIQHFLNENYVDPEMYASSWIDNTPQGFSIKDFMRNQELYY